MSKCLPKGFSVAGVAAGLKKSGKEDLCLIAAENDCVAAGVYTQNQVVAAPVLLDRDRTPSNHIRAIVCNSGNANACTGDLGMKNALRMAEVTSQHVGCSPEQVLVLSTGIIGEQLPMKYVEAGIAKAAAALGEDAQRLELAARAMMTTDTHPKIFSQTLALGNQQVQLVGLAKGAAMIGPNMATMLGVVLTDAPIASDDLQTALSTAVADSFNCISVEGHMSTNDTVLVLSSSRDTEPLKGDELSKFQASLNQLCIDLARSIPADGEGATHLIEIHVDRCETREHAHRIAKTVADSPLVKTAVCGADPNWGRIVSAAGYAGVPFDPARVSLKVNGFEIYRQGQPLDFDAEQVSSSIRENRDTLIQLSMGIGDASVRFWTCDLTTEYVHLNADYHT